MATLTNDDLGARIGVSHAMASRLRNGHRLPSIRVVDAIHREFGVPLEELHSAHLRGAPVFGALLRAAIAAQATEPERRAAA